MDQSSPTKRRALAPLDANANSPRKLSSKAHQMDQPKKPAMGVFASPSKAGTKRPLHAVVADNNAAVAAKKQCQNPEDTESDEERIRRESSDKTEELDAALPVSRRQQLQLHQDRQRTHERSPSSVTLTADDSTAEISVHDTTQDTSITEPDNAASTSIQPARQSMTREQTQRQAQALRARLGLATYKVRTGQIDVPLETLERRHMPGMGSITGGAFPVPASSADSSGARCGTAVTRPATSTSEAREAANVEEERGEDEDEEAEEAPRQKPLSQQNDEVDQAQGLKSEEARQLVSPSAEAKDQDTQEDSEDKAQQTRGAGPSGTAPVGGAVSGLLGLSKKSD